MSFKFTQYIELSIDSCQCPWMKEMEDRDVLHFYTSLETEQ